MYVHIGGDVAIRQDVIVGIMDIENTSVSKITREFLAAAQQSGRVVTISPEMPKAYVITAHKVYITPVSPATLLKRVSATGRTERNG